MYNSWNIVHTLVNIMQFMEKTVKKSDFTEIRLECLRMDKSLKVRKLHTKNKEDITLQT